MVWRWGVRRSQRQNDLIVELFCQVSGKLLDPVHVSEHLFGTIRKTISHLTRLDIEEPMGRRVPSDDQRVRGHDNVNPLERPCVVLDEVHHILQILSLPSRMHKHLSLVYDQHNVRD
ncbi:hypothetical protein FQZ97_1227830 [compost metagenome]